MCIMCLEIEKNRMRANEVVRAMGEFKPEPSHEEELKMVIRRNFTDQELADAVVEEFRKAIEFVARGFM